MIFQKLVRYWIKDKYFFCSTYINAVAKDKRLWQP
jgi:hypothetical protein